MAAYLIADVEVHDPEVYAEYRRQVLPLVEQHGGRFIVRGGRHQVLEGEWRPQRVVIIEFPDMAALEGWYRSPDYTRLIALRQARRAARSSRSRAPSARPNHVIPAEAGTHVTGRVESAMDHRPRRTGPPS